MVNETLKSRSGSKKTEAEERQLIYSSMTPEDRIKELDSRLGKGVGAVKERRKLKILMEAPVPKPKEEKKEKGNPKGKKKKGM